MKKINYQKIAGFVTALSLLLLPAVFSFAAGPANATIDNPLGANNTSLNDLLIKIMRIVTTVGSIVVVFFIIYSGFKFVTAGDSDSDRTKAKDIFYATIIGAAILLGANVIATIIVGTVENTTGIKIR